MNPTTSTSQIAQAELLRSLHVPGSPLIVTNVWDAVTARVVAETPGVQALATASHAISFAHGVPDGEGLTLDQALAAAKLVIDATTLPVSVDFERGYSADAAGVENSVARLIEIGAAGLNIEDSTGDAAEPLFSLDEAVARVKAVRRAAAVSGVPLVLNARVDALARGGEWDEMVERANAYLKAGADVIFVLGLNTEEKVERALAEIKGLVSVVARPAVIPLKRLAELGVARVSFGPGTMGLVLAHLRAAAQQVTALGDYPEGLDFKY